MRGGRHNMYTSQQEPFGGRHSQPAFGSRNWQPSFGDRLESLNLLAYDTQRMQERTHQPNQFYVPVNEPINSTAYGSSQLAPWPPLLRPESESDENLEDKRNIKLKSKIVLLETISGLLSIACLITSIYFVVDEGFDKYANLTRSVIIYSRKPENTFAMRTWITQYNNYCPSHPQQLVVPAWETLNEESYDGFGLAQAVKANKLYIWPLAFAVFVFSAFFQLSRAYWWKKYFNPLAGPDYGRWLEYLVTSPFQVVLVAIAFGFSDRDQLLSWACAQAALVILGYSIEKQIKKVYIRKIINPKIDSEQKQNLDKFYNILINYEVRDVRLFVYLALAWLIHFTIWGIPIVSSVGIGSRYALQEHHNEKCEKDEKFKIPDFVLGLYWSQFICFSAFGAVATFQVFQAFNEKLDVPSRAGITKNDVKKSIAYNQRWGYYSLSYAILSVTCKTLLEVFFVGFIRMYTNWPIVPTPAFSVNNNNLQKSQPYRISNVISLNTTTTQLNVKDFNSMCYLYPLQK